MLSSLRLVECGESRETCVTAVVEDNFRKLQIRARGTHDPHGAKIQSLEDDLHLHVTRKRDLEDELAERKHEMDRFRRLSSKTGDGREKVKPSRSSEISNGS